MPETNTQSTALPDKYDRLSALRDQMTAILKNEDGSDRAYSDEEAGRFDALNDEARVLKAEIKTQELAVDRAKSLANLDSDMDKPRKLGFSLDRPQTDAERPPKIKGYSGRLRAFESAEDAYKGGMHLLASMHVLTRDGIGETGAWADRFCREHGMKLAVSQSEGDNVRGGFLVFPTMEAAIVKLREQYGVVRANFAIKPMLSDTRTWPRELGSHTVYYPEENGEITASAMKWEQCSVIAKKAAALARMSRELDEDSVVGMADEIAENMAWKFSYAEDLNGFIGDGTSTYAGMTGIITKLNAGSGATYAGSIYTAIAGNTAFSTLDLADFEAMVGMLPTYAERGAKWYLSKAGWAASMLRLLDASGGNTAAQLAGSAPREFLGYPVVFVQVMNNTLTAQTSTAGLCLLGDLTQCCYLGNRRGITVDTSTDRYFEYDQVGIKATERFGITCVPGDPSAPTTAAGPVVMLSTPGA